MVSSSPPQSHGTRHSSTHCDGARSRIRPFFEISVSRPRADDAYRPTERQAPFPDAYFHLPDELETELEEGGLVLEGVFPVEGPAFVAQDVETLWQDPPARESLLWAATLGEEHDDLSAVTAHLLGVARKPLG